MSGSRRRWLWWVLAVAFVVVPLVEVYLLVKLGQVIGAWWTILLLIADGILGSLLVRREGGRAWQALQAALTSHRMPATELADGASDGRRQVVGDGERFERLAELRAERADGLPVLRPQARQPLQPAVEGWRSRQDAPEGLRRDAEARRHAHALEPRERPQVRALPADERDLRPVDLVEAHKWFNLAALNGCTRGQACRAEISVEMTAREIAEAQKSARAWLALTGRGAVRAAA